MSDMEITTTHLDAARAEAAHHARDALVSAAQVWAGAPKHHVGAVAIPAGPVAATAFSALFRARCELASHVGGEAAALVTAAALTEASVADG